VSEIKRILQQITALSDVPEASVLKRLVDELRASDKEPELANARIQELIEVLQAHPEYADGLASFVLRLLYSLIPELCRIRAFLVDFGA